MQVSRLRWALLKRHLLSASLHGFGEVGASAPTYASPFVRACPFRIAKRNERAARNELTGRMPGRRRAADFMFRRQLQALSLTH